MKRFLLAYLGLLGLASTSAQIPGNLDSNFNGKGWTRVHFAYAKNVNDEFAPKVIVKGDGKYLVLFDSYFTLLTQYNSDGTLDRTFGDGGYSDPAYMYYETSLLQPDGKIIVAGSMSQYPTQSDFAVTRYNTDGTLDNSFGQKGTASIDFYMNNDYAYAVAIQGDGKIVLGGQAYDGGTGTSYFALGRFNSNGTVDSSFGTNGKVVTSFGIQDQGAFALLIQADDKIVAAGRTYNSVTYYDFALARYKSDGTPDSTFNGNGMVQTDLSNESNMVNALSFQGDKLIASGNSYNGYYETFSLIRYNTDGSVDGSFGTSGVAYADFGYGSRLNSAIVLPDSSIVAGGYVAVLTSDLALARFKPDGTLDSSFGTNGLVATDISGSEEGIMSLAVLANGSIVASGYELNVSVNNADLLLVRYNSAGVPDSSFNGTGVVTGFYPRPFDTYMGGIAVQSDGKKVVAGEADLYDPETGYNNQFGVARFKTDGTLDSSFGTNGVVLTDFDTYYASAYCVGIQNNYIVVGGYTDHYVDSIDTYDQDFALARYTSTGVLDSSFGSNGKVVTDMGSTNDASLSIGFLNTGQIVLGGVTTNKVSGSINFAIACYSNTGTLYSGFGSGGKVTNDMFGNGAQLYTLAVQSDGKIIAAGTATTDTSYYDFAIARYLSNGTLDATFGTGGKVNTDFGTYGDDEAFSVVIQGDGKIVVGGYAEIYNEITEKSGYDFGIARYNSNGTLDAGFGTGGIVLTPFDHDANVHSLALQSDGKLLATGVVYWNDNFYNYFQTSGLARYNTTGLIDNTFGTSGKVTTDISRDYGQNVYSSAWNNGRLYEAGYFYTISGPSSGYIISYYTGGTAPSGNPLISINNVTVNENAGTATLNVTLNKPAPSAITIAYATEDSTAVSKGRYPDYKAVKSSVIIAKGASSAPITITIKTDNQNESNEFFKVVLSINRKMLGLAGFADSVGVVTIVNVAGLSNEETVANGREVQQLQNEKLNVRVSPNPSSGYFTLELQTSSSAPVSIVVTEASGRIVETRTVTSKGAIQLGSGYHTGMYYVQVIQNDKKSVVKLVKQ